MTTMVVYAGTSDGRITSLDEASYANARAGTGFTSSTTTNLDVGQSNVYRVYESFLGFDTSAIDDTDTVSAAVLNLTASTDYSTTDFTIEARLKDWGTSVTNADWVAGADLSGLTLLAHYATSGGFTANTAYDFVNDAMPANVSKTVETRMMLCSDRTTVGTAPSGNEFVQAYSANETGTTKDPKLTVTHAAAASGPVWTTPGDAVAMSATPALAFTMPTAASPMFFNMQLDTSNAFNTGNLRNLDSSVSQTGWEYWTGAAWATMSGSGVPANMGGNEARHTIQSALSNTTWYRRVRSRT